MNQHTASHVGCSMAFTVFVPYAVAFGFRDFKAPLAKQENCIMGRMWEKNKRLQEQLKAAETQKDRSVFLVVSASLELRPMRFLL